MLKPLAVSALALCCFGSLGVHAADVPPGYDYPYQDPWLATASVALLKDPQLPEKQVKDVTVYPARARTPLFEDKARVYYVTYRQEKPADLVVLISGLGSVAEDPLALYLGGQIFAMGYNVLVIPNAFNWQFALGASRSGYPGVPSVDAGDLENFIVHARDHAVRVDGMKIQQTKLVGYSMGALEGAFLAAREAQHPRLKFDKVVLLNPPVDTFYDLRQLDALAETGKNWSADEKKTIKARAFDLVVNANLTDPQGAPYFRDLAKKNTLTDDQLKYVLFGLFRNSLSDVIMVSQQIKDEGILKSPASKTSLDAREKEAAQYGFADYLDKFVMPQLGDRQAASQMVKTETLYGLHDFLASHHEVEIFHNADDFLVRPEDIAYLQSTLTNRLTLFPHGGHMGNIWYPVNQQMLAKALGSGPVVPPPAPPAPPAATAVETPAAPAIDTAAAPVVPAVVQAPLTPASVQPVEMPAVPPATPTETAQSPPATMAVPMIVAAPPAPLPGSDAVQTAPTTLAPPPSALSPPGTPAPPVTTVVAPPAVIVSPAAAPAAGAPAEDPLAVQPQSVTTTTTQNPAPSPSYTVRIPQIPSGTPATPPSDVPTDKLPPS
ncbi:MAG: uncharacterized protein JWO51_4039 [Rhodospirillales bacterium]|nr:uncharacterized protein [Rhodospirillales bacterium]